MAIKSKFFRVAVEGATTDGREIERDWIQQMAATYNRAKYGARVFAEHIRGIVPDGPFRALGDVMALKSEEIADGDLKGKMALYAQINPTDAMVKLIRSGQKIYSSIEIDHNFAGSKLAYLTGLGVTDSPASLGTDVLTFAAKHPDANPFRGRKQRPENLFSEALETDIELTEDDAEGDQVEGLFGKLQTLLEKFTKASAEAPAPAPRTEGETNPALAELVSTFSEFGKQTSEAIEKLSEQVRTHQQSTDAALDEFRQQLDTTPAPHKTRPSATGGEGVTLTDC